MKPMFVVTGCGLIALSVVLIVVSVSADSDGDGVVNSVDCHPFDGTTWAVPGDARAFSGVHQTGGSSAHPTRSR